MATVTMKDVAERAGVSVSSVSLVLSGKTEGRINATVAADVKNAVRELNYHRSRMASSLRTRRSMIIGLISDVVSTTPYAGEIILGAQDAARDCGYVLLSADSSNNSSLEDREVRTMHSYQADGFLYAKMSDCVTTVPDYFDDDKVVVVDARDASGRYPSISPDEYQIGVDAVRRLQEAGCSTIAYFGTPADLIAQQERLAGVREEAQRCGIRLPEELVVNVDEGQSALDGSRRLFDRAAQIGGIDGIVCFNDIRASYLYREAERHGLRIGTDVSIVSVDNNKFLAWTFVPSLSSIELPHYEMGYWAVLKLVDLIGAEDRSQLRGLSATVSKNGRRVVLPSIDEQDARIHCRLIDKESVRAEKVVTAVATSRKKN